MASKMCLHGSFLLIFWIFLATRAYGTECLELEATQYPFPIVLKGSPHLRGYDIKSIAAYTHRDGNWQRVSIQIDEVNRIGDYVLEEGLPFTANSDDGIYDYNDEIVFYGDDLGFIPEGMLPPPELMKRALSTWRVDFCTDTSRVGSILFVINFDKANLSVAKERVRYDAEAGQIESRVYRYKFHHERAALLGQVELKGDQGQYVPIFEASRFLMPLKLPWYLPNFDFDSENFTSVIESWRQGPVRTIVAVGVKLNGFLSIFDFHMFSELVFYESSFQIPTVVEFTFSPEKYFHPGTGLAYSISYAKGVDWSIETNLQRLPKATAAKVFADGERASAFPRFYANGQSTHGSFSIEVRVDEEATRKVPPPFLIREEDFLNSDLATYWSFLPKIAGDLGIFLDISGVSAGVYDFGLDLILHSGAEHKTVQTQDPIKTTWKFMATR